MVNSNCNHISFTVIRKREGLGGGDVKLISALAAWIGWYNIPVLIVLSSIIGEVFLCVINVNLKLQ